jgi:hypothetical protein
MPDDEQQPRRVVPRREPSPFGPFKIDWKLPWILGSIVAIAITIYASFGAQQPIVGIVVVISIIVLYGALVYPNVHGRGAPITFLYRKTKKEFSETKYLSDQPGQGELVALDRNSRETIANPPERRRPKKIKQLGRVDFLPFAAKKGDLGIGHDFVNHDFTVTFYTAVSSFATTDAAMKDRLLRNYARVQDDMAYEGTSVRRFAWQLQTMPRETVYPKRIFEQVRKAAVLTRPESEYSDRILDAMAKQGDESVTHRLTMTLAFGAGDVKRGGRNMGGEGEFLYQRANEFYSSILGKARGGKSPIGVRQATPLSLNELILENRLALDPVFAQDLWERWGRLAQQKKLSQQDAWPKFVDFSDDHMCWLGDTLHSCYYVTSFGNGDDSLETLWNLLKVPIPKRVTLVHNMLTPKKARRRAEMESIAALGRTKDRVVANRYITEGQQVLVEDARRHEGEVARNLGRVGDVVAYIDLTAASKEEMAVNQSVFRKAWIETPLMVNPLTGMQEKGIAATMPLARGLDSMDITDWF